MTRNREVDFLKGFAIFFVVFDHVGWGGVVHTYVQSFHMPLFFIVSGYLWKSGRSIGDITKRRTKTSLIPYAVFSGFYLIILCIANYLGKSEQSVCLAIRAVMLFPTDMQNIPYAPALWFLPCFFFSNVLYAWFDKQLGSKKWIPVVIIAVVGMTYSSMTDVMLPFTLEPLAVALLFMLLGGKSEAKRVENILFFRKMVRFNPPTCLGSSS